ncbi:MAG: flagellar basal body protein FliL [Spirochaetaceae bacterium]|jgi:flagellar basal body-associated protein FliL|nr:flagellar basal body protein FliL [Spirochaetaceae bacterium]
MREEKASRRGIAVYRVLLGTAAVLALVLLAGTLYALVFRSGGTGPQRRTRESLPRQSITDGGVFTGIGRLRASTAGPEPVTVILSVVFPYPLNDKAFMEELASQIANFRNTTQEYFVSLPTEELRRKDDDLIKAEILHRYNRLLRLGQIETLYFSEYLVIE